MKFYIAIFSIAFLITGCSTKEKIIFNQERNSTHKIERMSYRYDDSSIFPKEQDLSILLNKLSIKSSSSYKKSPQNSLATPTVINYTIDSSPNIYYIDKDRDIEYRNNYYIYSIDRGYRIIEID